MPEFGIYQQQKLKNKVCNNYLNYKDDKPKGIGFCKDQKSGNYRFYIDDKFNGYMSTFDDVFGKE